MSDYNDGLLPEPCLRLDYGFGQQYASVELGDGTGYVRVTDELRSEYHKMKRWYDDELRAALAENKKLRAKWTNCPRRAFAWLLRPLQRPTGASNAKGDRHVSEYTPITGELRDAMVRWGWCESDGTITVSSTPPNIEAEPFLTIAGSRFDHLCDAIDSVHASLEAEHEKAMTRAGQLLDDAEKERDYNYANWQECKQKVLQGNITFDELNARVECLEDELSHCIELPKDADGEHIHIGDVMECEKLPNGNRVCGEVKAIGNGYVWLMNVQYKIRAEYLHHYHAPTVEDVLLEFANEVYADADNEIRDRDFLCAKYAKRLTLAGDAE